MWTASCNKRDDDDDAPISMMWATFSLIRRCDITVTDTSSVLEKAEPRWASDRHVSLGDKSTKDKNKIRWANVTNLCRFSTAC